jgi:hypothetical protein
VLEAVFILLEFPSPSRRIFIGSHSLPPLWFAVSVLHDRNTSLFQAKSKERAKSNKITALKQEDDTLVHSREEIEAVTTGFYRSLFTAQDDLAPEVVLDHVQSKVTDAMNDEVTKPFTAAEVEKALFMMGANKAPRPDSFTAGFFSVSLGYVGANYNICSS